MATALLACLGVSAAMTTTATASPAARAGRSVGSPIVTRAEADRIGALWTPERMRTARDADVAAAAAPKPAAVTSGAVTAGSPASIAGAPPAGARPVPRPEDHAAIRPDGYPYLFNAWDPTSQAWPYSTVGRLFFTDDTGQGFGCSGSVVVAGNKSTVDTAGHCVFNADTKKWFSNWSFCPAYRDGKCPYGTWVARQAWTRSEWQNKQWEYDLGEVVMWYNSRGPLTDIVGSAGIAWNYDRNQYFEHLGYPFYPPFSGNLHECDAPYATQENPDGVLGISGPNTIGIGCDSTEGSSGGPWFFGFNSGSSGWVNGHTSYSYDDRPLTKYSPYFGSTARDLYNTAANS